MIKRKCIEAKPKTNFNEYKDDINRADSIFEKAWKDKTPLREISKVEISKEVLDWFLNLEETFVISDEEQERLKKRRPNVSIKNNHPVNWKRTKYLFTLYIWTKIQENYLSRPNIHYLQNYVKRFREDADLKPSFSLNNERNLLYDLGFIDINYALGVQTSFMEKYEVFKVPITDENRIVIELYKDGIMKDKDGKLIPEEVGDLHRCGYWLEKQRMGSFICESCGKEIAHYSKKPQEKNRKFCKQCLSKKLDMIERKCVDCEKIIFINNKFDKKTCRCQECQSEINKQNRQKARIKYRLKQKSG